MSKKIFLRLKALVNDVNMEHIVFSTVLKRKKVVKSKRSLIITPRDMARQQTHVEIFFIAETCLLLFTKHFRKNPVERKWSATFLVVSMENFREQRYIRKKKTDPL